LCLVGWGAVALGSWPIWGFVLMGLAELTVPVWAEAAEKTPWHPEHIAERYGLFTLIVLGESILASSVAFQVAVDGNRGDTDLVLTAVGALLTVFSMWWVYFAKPSAESLVSNRVGFLWGYGHFVVFGSAAAVGAGVAVVVDSVTQHAHLSDTSAAAAFTIPVVLYVLAVGFLQRLLHHMSVARLSVFAVAAVCIGVATFTGEPVLATGVVLALLVATMQVLAERTRRR
jgi:low temperature requirement protein LtrA